MTFRAVIAAAVLCVGCAMAPPDNRAERFAEVARVSAQARDRGEITAVQRSQLMREIHTQMYGRVPGMDEYWAYHAYISSEVDARRITQLQADALITQRQGEIRAREVSTAIETYKATSASQPPRPTECYTTRELGGIRTICK